VPLIPVGAKYVTNAQGKPLGPEYADPYGETPDSKGGQYETYDAYALVPIELDWKKVGGIAYWNKSSGLKITHFPAIHTRKGGLSYKLEWTPPGSSETLSMIYSGDTKPNYTMLKQAQGVDVLIHEMVMPPDQWASHSLGIPVDQLTDRQVTYMQTIQNSSHTTQGAFGYMLSQMNPRPRLTVATHFQAQDDTIASAQKSLDANKIPREAYTFAADLMMLNVTKDKIMQSRADVSRFAFGATPNQYPDPNVPKYHDASGNSDPNAQIDNTDWIPYTGFPGFDGITYDEDGY
jgi:ribonuclease Z